LSFALGAALDSAGLRRPSLRETIGWIGDGVEALVRSGLTAAIGGPPDPELLRATLAVFDRHYRDHLFVSSRLYAGVSATLDELLDAGTILGVITNKREVYARRLLDQAGIATALSFVYGSDSCDAGKPSPAPLLRAAAAARLEPGACVMIGDSANDRLAAGAAGFEFVYAAYGYGRADDPNLTAGFGVIRTFPALTRLLCPRRGAK